MRTPRVFFQKIILKKFGSDVADLKGLFERFSATSRDFSWPPHPFFGLLTDEDWMRWGSLHIDHHLGQFGA